MQALRIELFGRHAADLPTLRTLRRALEALGETPKLTLAPGVAADAREAWESGPLDCALRVVVARGVPVSHAGCEKLVVVWDDLAPPPGAFEPAALPDELLDADLVLVPGWLARSRLEPRLGCPVRDLGLARLDAPLAALTTQDGVARRAEARRELALPQDARVLLWAPDGDDVGPTGLGGEVAREIVAQTVTGAIVLIHPGDPPHPWEADARAQAATRAGLALLEPLQRASALAACDVLITPELGLLYEAAALGRASLWLAAPGRAEPEPAVGPTLRAAADVSAALRGALGAGPEARHFDDLRDRALDDLLANPGNAGEAMAQEIRELVFPGPVSGPRPATPVAEPQAASDAAARADAIDARLAFGDVAGARAELRRLVSEAPSASLWRRLGALERKHGEIADAREALDRAEALAGAELATVLCERARIAIDAGSAGEGRALFERAHELAPGLVDPVVGLGSLSLHAGDPAAAERWFRRALELEKSPRALAGLGLACVALGRAREALTPLEEALDLEPDSAPAVHGLVQAAYQTGELEAAERRVRAFSELHSGNLDMAFTLAGLRQQLGDRDGARAALDRIELFDPAYPGLAELRAKLD